MFRNSRCDEESETVLKQREPGRPETQALSSILDAENGGMETMENNPGQPAKGRRFGAGGCIRKSKQSKK